MRGRACVMKQGPNKGAKQPQCNASHPENLWFVTFKTYHRF